MKTYTLPCGVGDRVRAKRDGVMCDAIVHEISLDGGFGEWLFTVYFVEDRYSKKADKILYDVPYDYGRFLERDFGTDIEVIETLKGQKHDEQI